MTADRSDVLQGTLELLVLRTFALEPMHGWGWPSGSRPCRGTCSRFSMERCIQRMKRKGWESEWRVTENNRRARCYFLAGVGRRRIATERAEWERTVNAVNGVLNWAGGTK